MRRARLTYVLAALAAGALASLGPRGARAQGPTDPEQPAQPMQQPQQPTQQPQQPMQPQEPQQPQQPQQPMQQPQQPMQQPAQPGDTNPANETDRGNHLAALRARQSTADAQAKMISAMSSSMLGADPARKNVDDRVTELRARLDDAKRAIDTLAVAGTTEWQKADQIANDSLKMVGDSLQSAWTTLDDALRARKS
jgi:hypothetical protein